MDKVEDSLKSLKPADIAISWFAYISPSEPCLLEDVLITPKHSLCRQVNEHYLPKLLPHQPNPDFDDEVKARNMLNNIDGLGVAWYTSSRSDFEPDDMCQSTRAQCQGLRPALYRAIQPPLGDLNFRSICANTESRVCFGHIRAASGTAIATVNNHPFAFGRHIFMHNGTISNFFEIRRDICMLMSQAAYAAVSGSTDSEHLAGLYMTYLTDGKDESSFDLDYPAESMAEAMHKTVATVLGLQQIHFGKEKRPNSLNLCATDGINLVAYRFRNHKTSQPPSLYYSTKAGVTLNRKYPGHPDGPHDSVLRPKCSGGRHGKHLIIASEPSTYKESDWELVGRNQFVLTASDGSFRVEDIPYAPEWDAGTS